MNNAARSSTGRLAALHQFIVSACSEVSVVVKLRLFGLVGYTIAANSKMS